MLKKVNSLSSLKAKIITLFLNYTMNNQVRGDSQLMPIYGSDQNGRSLQTPSPLLKATINWPFFLLEL